LLSSFPSAAHAASMAGGELLGEFAASGILFKDSVQVSALADRDLPGVTVYVSDFKRSITDKLSKDFFSEPSQASLTCVLGGDASSSSSPLSQETTESLARRLGGNGGVEVFAERKGLNLLRDKTLRVRRLFDADRRAAVYVAYSTRLGTAGDEGGVSTGRYRTSICAVPLPAYARGAAAAGEQQQ
jgi:catabolite regulation protein CreA